ncbi:MAG: RNA polymerase-associated protein RapA [Spirochaetota bacterium]
MQKFKTGQRWISEMELNLGLGTVKEINKRTVNIYFAASDCTRLYAIASAPIKRVEFNEGDIIQSRDGLNITVKAKSEKDGIIIYHSDDIDLPETELKDSISFTTPKERLIGGLTDASSDFNLRFRALDFQHRMRRSRVRGFTGGRINLIPHQLYVANEITSMHAPRALLSDETGLGKTIETCLVLHRLLLCERIDRVLILVPNSLVNQWFVELLRRFNIIVRIFDPDLKESMKSSDSGVNPFLESQLCISSTDFLTYDNDWRNYAVEAGWDMVIIDEAHHLLEDSPEYRFAKDLGAVSAGLLLLTATPEQFGTRSHFSRLHLLDPERYFDFGLFEKEENEYFKISGIINKLLEKEKLNEDEAKILSSICHGIYCATDTFPAAADIPGLIKALLDRFGAGRAIFRNTRAVMKGFPERIANLIPLKGSSDNIKNIAAEFESDSAVFDFSNDPRITWLVSFIQNNKDKKVLLICRSMEKAIAIGKALRKLINADIALFHENLSLLQRDQNAARFAHESGARMLICSEIGSEGRNFQFSHDLVLFDLPPDPELLEQRIGRLDRIGQEETINIHILYLTGSAYEILARWYHYGLDAFEHNVPGAHKVYQAMGDRVKEIASAIDFSQLEPVIEASRALCAETAQKLHEGRDRLLELNSFSQDVAESIIDEIITLDSEPELEELMLDIFHAYGIREDFISTKTYKLTTVLSGPDFPLPASRSGELRITFDRKKALSREDIEFISSDHPMVTGSLELLLGSEKGNAAAVVWRHAGSREILLEAVYVLECVAPKKLYADRFLPPVPVRSVVNHELKDYTYNFNPAAVKPEDMAFSDICNDPTIKQLLPAMMAKCTELAEGSACEIRSRAAGEMEAALGREVERVTGLHKINKNIKEDVILHYKKEANLLGDAIRSARLRLDSLRFIFKGDDEAGV